MTDTLQDLDRRIESARELRSITRTMRGLAAVSVARYEQAATSARSYEAVIEDALHVVLRDGGIERLTTPDPPPDAPTGVIVFGSNQGLCGAVNRQVVAHAASTAERQVSLQLVAAVGVRLAAELEAGGIHPEARWDLPSTVENISPRAEQVLDQVEMWRSSSRIAKLLLVYPRFRGRHLGYRATTVQLTPTDRPWLESLADAKWPTRVLPTYSVEWDQIMSDLMHHALFVRLHHAFAHTMASVAASRLIAMDGAQNSIEERLEQLHAEHRQMRQAQITDELLDVVSGFETLEQPTN